MASPEQLKRATTKLEQWLAIDRRIVSYREVAREVKCDVSTAKNILKDHLAANPGLFATYLLSGELVDDVEPSAAGLNGHGDAKPGGTDADVDMDGSAPPTQTTATDADADDADRMTRPEITALHVLRPVAHERVRRRGMFLVGADQVEARKALFVPGTMGAHVYSLSPARISDPNNYLACTVRLRTFSNYYDAVTFGGLTGGFELATTASGKRGESSKSKLPAAVPALAVKAEAKAKDAAPAGKTGTLNFGTKPPAPAAAKADNKSAGAVVKQEPAASAGGKGKGKEGTSVAAGQPSSGRRPGKRVVRSEDEDEDEEMEEQEEPAPPKNGTQAATAPKPPPQTMSQEDMMAMQAMLEMSDDVMNTSEPASSDRPAPVDEKTPAKVVPQKRQSTAGTETGASAPPGKMRKKRRVKKQVQSMDAKGYMVFEDVSTDESYESDGESTPQPAKGAKKGGRQSGASTGPASKPAPETAKAKPAPVAKAAPPKKRGQQSMLSFMKK